MKARGAFTIVSLVIAVSQGSANAQSGPPVRVGVEYDAREFLSATEQIAFRKIYLDFDEPKAIKAWEWADVDPLGLFSAAENRVRRRNLFLYELSPSTIENEEEPTAEQIAFKLVIQRQIENSTVVLGKQTVKVRVPYEYSYESDLPRRNLLERTAKLGLEWAQLGGQNLYIYNGPVLLSRYKSGYVSLALTTVDQPPKRNKLKKQERSNIKSGSRP